MRRVKVSKLIDALPALAESLRAQGFKVGTSQVVEAARLLDTYAVLKGTAHLPVDEAAFVIASALGLPGSINEVADSIASSLRSSNVEERFKVIEEGILEMLDKAKLKPGQRVSKKTVARGGGDRRERIASYLDLKRLGVISRIRGEERVASRRDIARMAWRLALLGYGSVEDAVRHFKPPQSEDDLDLHASMGLARREDLERLSTDALLRLARRASEKRRRRLLEEASEELARRIRSGQAVDSEALKYLEEAGLLGPVEEAAILARKPGSVDTGLLSPEDIVRIASSLTDDKAAQLIAKALKESRSEERAWSILERVDVHLLWRVGRNPLRGERRRLLEAAVDAARSLREAIAYIETGLEGHAEMSRHLAESSLRKLSGIPREACGGKLTPASVEAVARLAEALVASVGNGETERLTDALARLDPATSIAILRGIYRRGDEALRDRSVRLAEKLLERLSSTAGSRLLPKKVQATSRPGRLEVRATIYRMIRRRPDTLVFKRRLKARQVSMALDVSGSMSRYSLWALSIALAFARNIRDLILFSHRIERLRYPFTSRQVAAALLSAEFEGLTDIYGALSAAADSASKRLIVLTDLKQTVQSGDVGEAVRSLVSRGFRVVFIVPPVHDYVARRSVEDAGARVWVAFKPEDAARRVLYVLRR
ncbi:VWA domain-containing protein [Stetteria hydrogenophila]